MKYLLTIQLFLVLVFLISGCNSPEVREAKESINSIEEDSTRVNFVDSMDFTIRETELICGNITYFNKTMPFIDEATNEFAANVLLYETNDTILVKHVNIDSLINAFVELEHYRDTISYTELKKYSLVGIVPTVGIRGCNTYLISKLSGEGLKDIFIGFAIKTFGDGYSYQGRLWIYSFSYDDSQYEDYKKLGFRTKEYVE